MGASESTARSNETNEEEPQNNSSDGSSIEAATAIATAIATAAATVAVAAWGVSRMLSNNRDSQATEHHVMQHSLVNSIANGGSRQPSTWSPPPSGRFKMNTDGACRPNYDVGNTGVQRGPSGYGGILRDHRGNWVQGFIGFIGESDCLTSEFHGILKGLELLDKLNLKGAILETDSQAAYEWVTRRGDHHGKSEIVRASWPMITKCRQLADKNGIAINLIPGDDANKCADKLANMGIDSEEEYVEIKYLPFGLRSLVEKDAKFYG